MKFFRLFVLALFATAASALLAPTPARAAIVSLSHDKLNQCGRGFVFCNGRQAYSLSEIESGALQIPVFPILPSEVVIVNDTGHTVTNLQFTLTTLELFSFQMQCQIQSSAKQYFNSCSVAKASSGFSRDLFGTVSAQFTFTAPNNGGIPDGAYFDITTIGFLPGGYLCGGGSGSGGDNGGGGSSGGGSGNSGPPQQ
jgi:hypothetical protein